MVHAPGIGPQCGPQEMSMAAVGINLDCVIIYIFSRPTSSGGLVFSEECLSC